MMKVYEQLVLTVVMCDINLFCYSGSRGIGVLQKDNQYVHVPQFELWTFVGIRVNVTVSYLRIGH